MLAGELTHNGYFIYNAEWKFHGGELHRHLTEAGAVQLIRSPARLALLLHGQAPGRGWTWEKLLSKGCLATLIETIKATPKQNGPGFATWNVRWMRDPHTKKAGIKRAILVKMAVKGVVVAIQETHRDPAAEQAWEALLPDTRIVSTGATVGPRGGPQGGVALVIPREHELLEWKVLKEGCGVAAKIKRKGEE